MTTQVITIVIRSCGEVISKWKVRCFGVTTLSTSTSHQWPHLLSIVEYRAQHSSDQLEVMHKVEQMEREEEHTELQAQQADCAVTYPVHHMLGENGHCEFREGGVPVQSTSHCMVNWSRLTYSVAKNSTNSPDDVTYVH